MKIIDKIWFTQMGGGLIGIIVGEDEATKEIKAYIGTGSGMAENADAQAIAERGAKFTNITLNTLNRLFNRKQQ